MERGPSDYSGGRGATGGIGLYDIAAPVVAGLFAFVFTLGLYVAVVRSTDGAVHAVGTVAVLLVPVGVAVWVKRAM